MLSYSRYLIMNLIKKKSIYLLMAFFLLINVLMVALRSIEENKGGTSLIKSLDMYILFFPFLLSTAFSLLIIIYNFKSTESDGSDLLICSKPITRLSIFSSKFLILILSMILFQIYAFISLLIAGAFDKEASSYSILTFAASVAFGGFIIQMIIASILVVCAAFMNVASIISVGLLFSAVIPIASAVITNISEAYPTKFWSPEVITSNIDRLQVDEEHPDSNYETSDKKRASADPEYAYSLQIGNASSTDNYYAWKQRNWYKKFAPFDIWYQWSGVMNIFRPERTVGMNKQVEDWYIAKGLLNLPKNYTFDVEFDVNGRVVSHTFALFTSNHWMFKNDEKNVRNDELGNTMPSIIRNYKSLETKGYITYDAAHQVTPTAALTKNEEHLLQLIQGYNTLDNLSDRYEWINAHGMNIYGHFRFFMYILHKQQERTRNGQIFSVFAKRAPSYPGTPAAGTAAEWINYKRPAVMEPPVENHLLRVDRPMTLYVSEPYIERKYIIEIWMGILAFMILTASIVYTRKEIK